MHHFRKNVLQKENFDRDELLKKKLECEHYQAAWKQQIEEKRIQKMKEEEARRKRDREIDKYLGVPASSDDFPINVKQLPQLPTKGDSPPERGSPSPEPSSGFLDKARRAVSNRNLAKTDHQMPPRCVSNKKFVTVEDERS